jgi:plasmid replication initiation protein
MKKGKRQMTHVVKDNALINASYNLELVEQRIVLQAIVKARETETGFDTKTPVFIHASEYEKQYNVTKDGAYKALKDAVLSLFERQFSYREINERGNTENVRSRWVSEVRYVDAEATVKLIFSPAVASMCSRLERHFTSYDLDQIAGLSSKYAVRLYELVIAWKATGKTPVFKLQDFRDKIGLLDENEYSTMSNFKKFVLDLAVDQINEHTDIKLTYEQHKTGRTITGFSFKFKQKVKQQKIEQQRDPNTIDLFSKMTDAQRHLLASKLSRLHEMSEYSVGNESYEDLAKRIAEKLLDEKFFKSVMPLFDQIDYKPY